LISNGFGCLEQVDFAFRVKYFAEKTMKYSKRSLSLTCIILLMSLNPLKSQPGTVNLHYLGHASFVMDFYDFKVLTDYGTSYCWGLNSPIYGIGSMIPAVMSYSHYHLDHYDESRVPPYVPYTIDMLDTLNIMDLWIYPVRTCETNPAVESNTSFMFNFMGYRICHLGDAQAEIMNIDDPGQQALFLQKFPDRIDLLLMTIEGIYPFIPEAEKFIDLIRPGVVVPMHYWSPEYKEEFLDYLELQNDTAGKSYEVHRMEGPQINVLASDTIHDHIKVIGLTPYPYGETGTGHSNPYNQELLIYPNPCADQAVVSFHTNMTETIEYALFDISGRVVISTKQHGCIQGRNHISLDLRPLSGGLYVFQIKSPNLGLINSYVLRRSR
jgi:L-ascorbate metabolism protein UlaG (beta-lactamase superfamily)